MLVSLKALPTAFTAGGVPVVEGYCENCRQIRQFSVVSTTLKRQKVVVWLDDSCSRAGWFKLARQSRFCRLCGWLIEPSQTPGGSRQGKRQRIFQLDRHECVYCGSTHQLTLDHLVPRSKGGTDELANLVTACEACNRTKANGSPARLQYGRFRSIGEA